MIHITLSCFQYKQLKHDYFWHRRLLCLYLLYKQTNKKKTMNTEHYITVYNTFVFHFCTFLQISKSKKTVFWLKVVLFLYFKAVYAGLKKKQYRLSGATINFEPVHLMGKEISCSRLLHILCFLYSSDLLHSLHTKDHPVPHRILTTCDSKSITSPTE